jgi:hypothetical protein
MRESTTGGQVKVSCPTCRTWRYIDDHDGLYKDGTEHGHFYVMDCVGELRSQLDHGKIEWNPTLCDWAGWNPDLNAYGRCSQPIGHTAPHDKSRRISDERTTT